MTTSKNDIKTPQGDEKIQVIVEGLTPQAVLTCERNASVSALKKKIASFFNFPEPSFYLKTNQKVLDPTVSVGDICEGGFLTVSVNFRITGGSQKSKDTRKLAKPEKKAVEKVAKKAVKKEAKKEIRKEMPRRKPFPKKMVPADKMVTSHLAPRLTPLQKDAFMAITCPADYQPIRMVDDFQAKSTAAHSVKEVFNLPWNATSKAGTIFLFRDVLRAMVVYDPNTNSGNKYYRALFPPFSDDAENVTQPQLTYNTRLEANVPIDLPITYLQDYNGSWMPHGTYLFCGVVDHRKLFWVDKNDTVSFVFQQTASRAETKMSVTFDMFNLADGWLPNKYSDTVTIAATDVAAHTLNFSISEAGYYSFKVKADIDLSQHLIQLYLRGTGPVWCHRCAPAYENNLNTSTDIRVIANAITATNVSPELDKKGTIACYQTEGSFPWTYYMNDAMGQITSLNEAPNVQAAKTGGHAFLKPFNNGELDYAVDGKIANGFVSNLYYPLDSQISFLVFTVAMEDNTTDQVFKITWAMGLQYYTVNAWIPVGKEGLTQDQYQAVMKTVSHARGLYENPTHWRDLLKKAGGYVQKGVEFAKWMMPYAEGLAQMAAVL